MSNAEPPPPPPPQADRLEAFGRTVAKYVAIVTALVTAAVPITEWIRGITNQKLKEAEEISNQKIKEMEQRSMLAIAYLNRIVSKETTPSDRILFLSAIAKLDGHPLQAWAQEQQADQKRQLDEVKKIIADAQDVVEAGKVANSKIAALESQIRVERSRLTNASTREEVDAIYVHLAALNTQKTKEQETVLAQADKVSAAAAKVPDKSAVVEQAILKLDDIKAQASGAQPPSPVPGAGPVGDDIDRLTPAVVQACWPNVSMDNVEQNLPYIKRALTQAGLTDKPMLVTAMAVMRINSEQFAPFTETQNKFNTSSGGAPFDRYENRTALGNTEPGDGARFRGRGFLGLTGRANYRLIGGQLGIEAELLRDPDIANQADVAARILATYLQRSAEPMRSALLANDFARALRLVTGGTADLAPFSEAARCFLQKL